MAAQKEFKQLDAIKHMQQPQHLPHQQPETPQVVRRRLVKKPKGRFYTFKMLLAVCGIGIFGLMFIQLYMDSQINHVHYEIQTLRTNINQELSRNEQWSAYIAELSQRSRIIEIAKERGLAFAEQIINISR